MLKSKRWRIRAAIFENDKNLEIMLITIVEGSTENFTGWTGKILVNVDDDILLIELLTPTCKKYGILKL